MRILRSLRTVLASAGIALLAAGCGGAAALFTGGGIGGTGISFGPIVAFGSIFVNGVEYETADAEIFVDDAPATENDLALGMLVTVTGSVNEDGVTGTASRVDYRTTIEGPVSEVDISADGSGLLVALGQAVETTPATVFDAGDSGIPSLDGLPVNALVEVSGYTDGTGLVVATRLEVEAADWAGEDVEVAGVVQDLVPDIFTFRIGELTVLWSEVTVLPAEPLANGLLVRVFSTRGFDGTGRLIAERIELENDGVVGVGEDGEEVDIRGIVTGPLVDSVFLLNGQPVRLTVATEFDDGTIADVVTGIELRVEGVIEDGEIVAEEIRFGDDFDIDSDSDTDSDSDSDIDSDSDSDADTDTDSDSDSDSDTDSDTDSDSATETDGSDSSADSDTETDSDTNPA